MGRNARRQKNRKLAAKMGHAMAIIFISRDDGKTWALVKPADVPEFVKKPDVMAKLLGDAGHMVQEKSEILAPVGLRSWYRAERYTPPVKETLQ